jgi:hypothetical protein
MSCSLTNQGREKGEIKKANAAKKVKRVFSKDQRALVSQTYGDLDWGQLRSYGPVKDIRVWKKIKVAGGPPLTVESWSLPALSTKPARILFEVSAKVPLSEEEEVSKWLAALAEVSSGNDQESETKTRIVLEHFKGNSQ